MRNRTRHFNLLPRTVVSETDCPQLTQDKCLTHQFLGQDKPRLARPRLARFWIPQYDTFQTSKHLQEFLCLHSTGEVHVGGQEHFYMETQRVLVIPKTEDKELDIYVSTQDPAHVQVRSRTPHLCNFLILSWPPAPTASELADILLRIQVLGISRELRPQDTFIFLVLWSKKKKNSHGHFRSREYIHLQYTVLKWTLIEWQH